MCGIFYVKDKNNRNYNENIFISFNKALSHMNYRGPDAKGVLNVGNHYFGHQRLSIIDTSNSSNQPYYDDNNVLIFNGEIYNYKELDINSNSDTKTLFYYLQNESESFRKVRGMFALGWYKKQLDEVVFYRDFYGEKPLYYFDNPQFLVVSSTIRSIKEFVNDVGITLTLNRDAIQLDYLSCGYIREPKTIWNETFSVPPGHKMTISQNNSVNIKPIDFGLQNYESPEDSLNYTNNAISAKDVEGTLLLSGGVDSSFLLARAKENDVPVTIGIYKAKDKIIDESEKALDHVRKLGLISNTLYPVYILDEEDGFEISLEEYVKLLEQPTSDGMQLYKLLKHLKVKNPKLKLVYTGLGGDEMFGGYPTFWNYNLINTLVRIPCIEYLIPTLKRFKKGRTVLGQWNYQIYSFLYRLNYSMYQFVESGESWIRGAFQSYKDSLDRTPIYSVDPNKVSFIKFSETFDYMRNQLLRDNDNISMYLGIESRSPLLNPDWWKLKTDKKKYLKESLKNKYDLEFGKKKGFTLDESKAKIIYVKCLSDNKSILDKILPSFHYHKQNISTLRSLSILIEWIKKN